ncbi:protocadherin-1-like isoform X1 [Brachionus plicatilis]|uniref:Protocadherin-1-like isoform X1 n=1 Tax=Brachionus plicatilis TaxID=10195 RepID=A0A3M7SN53_BRAPC|nr:protocadherin-1-like isoform X1 [Brachionus plicatilis]
MNENQITEAAQRIEQNVSTKMENLGNINLGDRMHKDPLVEANKYMCKKDVFELFKHLTANLVLTKPKDPIQALIDQLKEIEQSENKMFIFILLISGLILSVTPQDLSKKKVSNSIQDPRKNSSLYDLVIRDRVPYNSIVGSIPSVLIMKNLISKQTKILDYSLVYYSAQQIPSSLLSTKINTSTSQMYTSTSQAEPIFWVNSRNGSIHIKVPDRPILEYLCRENEYCGCYSCIFSLNIIYQTESKINGQTIRLFIEDSNDFAPQFYSNLNYFTLNISESAQIGDKFVLLNSLAFDSDAHYNQVSYYISERNAGHDKLSNLIEISRVDESKKDLYLTLKSHLDYEVEKKFDLFLFARDNGYPERKKSWKKLVINVVDENDNRPICDKSLFIENIKENLKVKHLIQITASDLDSGLNSKLVYKIDQGREEAEFFEVDQNGWLSVKSPLDYEKNHFIEFKVKVTDSGLKLKNSAFCSVRINIIDVNDNPAKMKLIKYLNESVEANFYSINSISIDFEQDYDTVFSLTNKDVKNQMELYENNPVNMSLGLIRVFDHDSLSNYKFLIQSATSVGEDVSMFSVRPSDKTEREFELIATKQFDSELIQNYRLKILLFDLDNFDLFTDKTSLMTKKMVSVDNSNSFLVTLFQRVKILDLNDNKPDFLSKSYFFTIKENEVTDFLIGPQIEVFDIDKSDKNSKINFKFKSNFSIEKHTKLNTSLNNYPSLAVFRPFDYEITPKVEFQMVAYDIDGHSDMTNIVINILNVNDNPPLFKNNNSTFKIKENSPIDSFVGQLIVSDRDGHGEKNFAMHSETYGNVFGIYKSGVVSNLVVLDREIQSFYTLKIEVFDNGSPNMSSIGTFYVEVEDENDNKPILMYPDEKVRHLNLRLEPTETELLHVLDVKAIDNDYGLNGQLKFYIHDSSGLLDIDPNSGSVTINTTKAKINSNLDKFKAIVDVFINVADNGSPCLYTSLNFTLYLNYDFSELSSEVQMIIQNQLKSQDKSTFSTDLYKMEKAKYNNFFNIVSNSVLLIILLSVLFFMLFVAGFITIIMFKKVNNNQENGEANSSTLVNCMTQMINAVKFNLNKEHNSRVEENLTVKDEIISGATEPVTVDNFRIAANSEPLMQIGSPEILNSESINESSGTSCSDELNNELNVYSQDFLSYDYYRTNKYQSQLIVSDEVRVVQKLNQSYATTSSNNTPSSRDSLMKNNEDIYQNELVNFNDQSYFKQSFKSKKPTLNNLSDKVANFEPKVIEDLQIHESKNFMEKFEKFYGTPDYFIQPSLYTSSVN